MNETFSIGSHIVYPGHGIGQVEDVLMRRVGGENHEVLQILLLDGKGTKITVPLAQAKSVGLRGLTDQTTLAQVVEVLQLRGIKPDAQTWNRRAREYTLKLKTGALCAIAEVMRDLSLLSLEKELSFGEKRMLESAEKLIASEIALIRSTNVDKVIAEIKATVSAW